nr:RNA-directed DNA polymerase, eukaryota [Tanacetum cinerariifolium]
MERPLFWATSMNCLSRSALVGPPAYLLKKIQTDFGPTPFRLYHSWFKREGFDAMVEQAWLSFSHNDSNSLIRFKKKLQDLKKIIRVWIRDMNILNLELSRKLNELNQSDLKDAAQKAKVKWAIESDENSKILHGIINKRRAQLAIRGVFDNDPASSRLKLNMSFSNCLTSDQIDDLERNISRDEIKVAVWDCGENKSPALAWCKRKKKQALIFKWILPRRMIPLDGIFFSMLFTLLVLVLDGVHGYAVFLVPIWHRFSLMGVPLLASGLKINMQKSQVLGVGVPSDVVIHEASTIRCNVMNSPFKYLGATVGDHMSRHSAWSTIIQKICSRLSMWKVKTLFIGGRLTLLKSVLGDVPLYTMSIYKAPKGVLHEMEMIRNKFFIRADSTVRKINWVAWDKVLASKKHGGLCVSAGILSYMRWSCDLNGEGMFRVKDIRSVLDDLFLPSSNEATRWAKYVSIKVNVFAWRARLDRLPTRDNLAKRGVIMDSSLCLICGLFPENAQHLFFGCDLARSIALRICHWWNLNWTEISSFAEWNSWSIFDDSPPKRSLLFDDIVSFSFNSCVNRCSSSFSQESWFKNPYVISL